MKKWLTYLNGKITKEDWLYSIANMYAITSNTQILNCQYKILHFILVMNEQLFKYKLIDSDLCEWCEEEIETLPHFLLECEVVKVFWNDLQNWLQDYNISYMLNNVTINYYSGIN